MIVGAVFERSADFDYFNVGNLVCRTWLNHLQGLDVTEVI